MKIAIVGLPNVGKSTLFNALTKNHVLAANYPFATIEPNVGIVPVPDERLDKLAAIYHPERVMPATVTFVDVAGLVRGASRGEGLGNQFLANIRETNAIVQVVRVFNDPNVTHVENKIDPRGDIETINAELILADIATVDSRLNRLQGELKRDPKSYEPIRDLLEQLRAGLNDGKLAGAILSSQATPSNNNDIVRAERELLRELQLLTAKPFIIVFNLDEPQLADEALKNELEAIVSPCPTVFLCAKVEAELAELPAADAAELLRGLGQERSGLEQLAQVGFKTLGLQTYLTAGPKEVRAWTIPVGATAPEAAGVIHTDFQRGFIKAEVVSYDELIAAGSEAAAKAAGKVRLEGKDYLVRDGDVIEFRFNV